MEAARSARGETRRTAILDVARSVLVEDGLDHFVLRNIAGRVGITLGNLQYYFPTRDDLLRAVIRAEFDRDVAIIRTTVEQSQEPGIALEGVARGLVEHWCDGGSIFSALTLLAYHHEGFRELNREIYETFYDELGTLIGAADPNADGAEVDARARLVASVLDGVAIQNHAEVGLDEAVCNELLERAGALVLRIACGRLDDVPTKRAHATRTKPS